MTDLEQLSHLAGAVIVMDKAGLIREMTDAEKEAFKREYPDAIMMLGNFLILKAKD